MYFIDPDGMWPNPFAGLWKAVKQTVKSELKSVNRAIANFATKVDNAIMSIPTEKSDKLKGNSTGHFKKGVNFVNKDKTAIENVRGNETSNSAAQVENMDTDLFPACTNLLQSLGGGLPPWTTALDKIDNIGNAADAAYTAVDQAKSSMEKAEGDKKDYKIETKYKNGVVTTDTETKKGTETEIKKDSTEHSKKAYANSTPANVKIIRQ